MAEPYIKRLQLDRTALIAHAVSVRRYLDALEYSRLTGRKESAFKEADRREKEMNEAFRSIEPILAEEKRR